MTIGEDLKILKGLVINDDVEGLKKLLNSYEDFKGRLLMLNTLINDNNNDDSGYSIIYLATSAAMINFLVDNGANINTPIIVCRVENGKVIEERHYLMIEGHLKDYLHQSILNRKDKFEVIECLLNRTCYPSTEMTELPLFFTFFEHIPSTGVGPGQPTKYGWIDFTVKSDVRTKVLVELREVIEKVSKLIIKTGGNINSQYKDKNLVDILLELNGNFYIDNLKFKLDIISDLVKLGLNITKTNKITFQELFGKNDQYSEVKEKIKQIKNVFDNRDLKNVSEVCKKFTESFYPYPKQIAEDILKFVSGVNITQYVNERTTFESRVKNYPLSSTISL